MSSKKILTLVRHAKSSWEYDVRDNERPLQQRGIKDASLVSMKLSDSFIMPDAVFSSPANRALTTCRIFMENLNIPEEKLTVTSALYDFGGSSVMAFIDKLDDTLENVMIFGHNHAFTEVSNALGSSYIYNLPTGGLVQIGFDADSWKNLEKGVTKLTIFPKDLK